MAYTIALSSDMNTVYIINSSNTVIFSGSLSGHGSIIYIDSSGELAGQTASSTPIGTPISKSTDDWQWTVAYNDTTEKLYFIGIGDDDTSCYRCRRVVN